MLRNDHFTCPTCHIGHLDLRLTTYVQQFGETLISVPNTPAWVCDVCHDRQFDTASIQRIELLVGQAGPPPNRYRSAQERMISRPTETADKVVAKARIKAKE